MSEPLPDRPGFDGHDPDRHDDDKEWTAMTGHDPDPAAALRRLAHEAAPPSRMDVARAAQDGLRLRRRRRLAQGLTGVATAGVVAAVAVLVPAHLGRDASGGTTLPAASRASAATHTLRATPSATPSATPACPTLVGQANAPLGADYRTEVPAAFGWLPADQVNQINEIATNYNADVGVSGGGPYGASARSTSHADVGVYLYVYPYAAEVPGQHAALPPGCQAPGGINPAGSQQSYEIPAPDVNGGKAYWYTRERGVIDYAGSAELIWRTPSGTWASVNGTELDQSTVEATLEHVADTATIGTVALAAPVQIKGMPAAAQLQPGQVVIAQPVTGDSGSFNIQVALTFGTGDNVAEAGISAYPAGTNPYTGNGQVSKCRTLSGWEVCASAPANLVAGVDAHLPGGLQTLVDDLVVLGPATSDWSPELITGTTG